MQYVIYDLHVLFIVFKETLVSEIQFKFRISVIHFNMFFFI